MPEEENWTDRAGGASTPYSPIPTLPKCPNCGQEVLIPFSGYGGQMTTYFPKTYAHWVCIKCGFYMGTGNRSVKDLAKDLEVKIVEDIKKKISEVTQR